MFSGNVMLGQPVYAEPERIMAFIGGTWREVIIITRTSQY